MYQIDVIYTMRMFCLISGLLFLISCNRIDEQDFFKFDIVDADSPVMVSPVEIDNMINTGVRLVDCAISYPYVFSYESGDHLFGITDISSGKYLGKWCLRGNGPEDPLYVLPITDIYYKGGDMTADLFSYHGGKLMAWNISESLRSDTDVYDDVIKIDYAEQPVPFFSVYRVSDSLALVLDTRQNAHVNEMIAAPSYDLYDTSSGNLVKRFDLFNMVVSKSSDRHFTSKSYLSVSDCMKPDKSRIAFAMRYMPVISVLDLKSGRTTGIRLKDAKSFTTRKLIAHFVDISADDDYIYALYYGRKRVDGSFPEILHIFDWDGNWVATRKLSHHASALQVSNGRLYLYNFDSDVLMDISLEKFKKL